MLNFRNFIFKLGNIEEDIEYEVRSIQISTTSYIVGQVPHICYDDISYETKYYLTPVSNTSPYPLNGEVLYDDSLLTSKFDGDGLFYKMKWGTGTASCNVGNNGELSLVSVCTQVIELGYSNSTSTDACDRQFSDAELYYTDDLGTVIYEDSLMTILAPSGYYAGFLPFGGTINKEWRYWNGTAFTSNGECTY